MEHLASAATAAGILSLLLGVALLSLPAAFILCGLLLLVSSLLLSRLASRELDSTATPRRDSLGFPVFDPPSVTIDLGEDSPFTRPLHRPRS